jgi:transketolase
VSPSPTEALAAALRNVSLAVTVEAHYVSGGLGSLVSEVVAESCSTCRVVRCGVARLPDVVGTERFLNDAHGLSAGSIARAAAAALDQRDRPANPVAAR